MTRILRIFLVGLISCAFFACAIQVPPSGGEKDIAPPKVLKMVPENYSTNVSTHDIEITFDEFIALKELASQLVVSPPLENAPVNKVRKRTLFVHFDDTLLANTTYTFNFGNGITDNNEGNPMENFQVVFSTGPVLDSLEIHGKIIQAGDLKTEKGILAMLYRKNEDSIPYLHRPVYFGKTNDAGEFSIRNISPGSYKIFALKESNADYLYNTPEESIAFSDSLVAVGQKNIVLQLFQEKPKFMLLKSYSEEPGKALVVFSGAADTVPMRWITDTTKLKFVARSFSREKDTIIFWYRYLMADTLQVAFEGTSVKDTATIRLFMFSGEQNSRRPFQLTLTTSVEEDGFQDLNQPLTLSFNHPLQAWKPDSIRLMEDSTVLTGVPVKFTDSLHLSLQLSPVWKEKKKYSLYIPPGTFQDIHEFKNDTLSFSFRTRQQNDYGSVAVYIHVPHPGQEYIMRLVDPKDVTVQQLFLSSDTTLQLNYLYPGQYRLKLITDLNHNRRWDTGDYLHHLEPEPVLYYPEAITVRANWDVEVKWKREGE